MQEIKRQVDLSNAVNFQAGEIFLRLDLTGDREVMELPETAKAECEVGGVMYRYGGWNGSDFTTFEMSDCIFRLEKSILYEHMFTRYGLKFYARKKVTH